MSRTILESKPGDGLYVTEKFYAREPGLVNQDRCFLVGQRVKYLGYEWYSKRKPEDTTSLDPVWMIRFEADGRQYKATQDFFLHSDAWHGLMQVFAEEVKKRQPAADNNYDPNKYGWVMTALMLLAISAFLWLVLGSLR
jgi:hypothetical protein